MPIRFDLDTRDLATRYDRTIGQFDHGAPLIEALAIAPSERVLDVGCGTGQLSVQVARLVGPGGEVIGLDPLPSRVELAQGKCANFSAFVGRAEDLSAFRDGSFDVVYMNSVLHWIEDKQAAVREAWRVLKPGGRFGANCADPERPHELVRLLQASIREHGLTEAAAASGAASGLSAAKLAELLQECGFRNVRVEARSFAEVSPDVDEVFAMASSMSFGNFLSHFEPQPLALVKRSVAEKLERFRTPDGLRLERHLNYAVAFK